MENPPLQLGSDASLSTERLQEIIQEGIQGGRTKDEPTTSWEIVAPVLPEAGDSKASKYRCQTIKPPTEMLEDEELYGSLRTNWRKRINQDRLDNPSECIMIAVNHFLGNQIYHSLKPILRSNPRLTKMAETTGFRYPFTVQSYCLPQLEDGKWPIVCIGPPKSGKTLCYVLHIICENIDGSQYERPKNSTAKEIEPGKQQQTVGESQEPVTNGHLANGDQSPTSLLSNEASVELSDKEESDDENFDYNRINEKYEKKAEQQTKEDLDNSSQAEHKADDSDDMNHIDNFMSRPKYFIICATQQKVNQVLRTFKEFKDAANYASDPLVESITTEDIREIKNSAAINGCDVLVSTPPPLLFAIQKGCVSFKRCCKFIVDDLDQTLQMHNTTMFNLVGRLIERSNNPDEKSGDFFNYQLVLFAEKWTSLVGKITNTILVQPTIIFASIIEAALYRHTRFEVERCESAKDKLNYLNNLLEAKGNSSQQIAIICTTEGEAFFLNDQLKAAGHNTALVEESNIEAALNPYNKRSNKRTTMRPTYIFSDSSLDQSVTHLNSVEFLIHFNLPKSRNELDSRFKLMSHRLRNNETSSTCLLMSSENTKQAHYLHDVLSRCRNKSNSSICELRALKLKYPRPLCWRFASLGVCRLEKLSKDDYNGTFCPFRHVVAAPKQVVSDDVDICSLDHLQNINSSIQMRVIITHIISPNEFYFWPEAYRTNLDISGAWTLLQTYDIKDMEAALYQLKDQSDCSINMDELSRNKIYGFYFRGEKRVYRVRCLDFSGDWCLTSDPSPNIGDKKLSQQAKAERLKHMQVKVEHIDYGHKSYVYLRSLFELPDKLAEVKPLAFRGFNIGIRPAGNEPEWSHKAAREFYNCIVVPNLHTITGWTRLIRENTFWFEHLQVKRYLANISTESKFDQFGTDDPNHKLLSAGLAEKNKETLPSLMKSSYSETISKWRSDKIHKIARYAFLRSDKKILDVYLCQFNSLNELYIRQADFNKQLIDLEDEMENDLQCGRVKQLKYFAPGTICLAKIDQSMLADNLTGEYFPANRCAIHSKTTNTSDPALDRYKLFCLDHGDFVEVNAQYLYECEKFYITRLPFQAIKVALDGLVDSISNAPASPLSHDMNANVEVTNSHYINNDTLIDTVYSRTRAPDNLLINLKCIKESGCSRNDDYKVRLYYPQGNNIYAPLLVALEQSCNYELIKSDWNRSKIDLSEMEDLTLNIESLCLHIFIDLLNKLVEGVAKEVLEAIRIEQVTNRLNSSQRKIKNNRLKAIKTLLNN